MEIRNHNLLLAAILFAAIIFLEPVSAFNLGTLQKSASQNVTSGDTISFELLFWNIYDEGYDVVLENVKVPKDWVVIVDPSYFYLDNRSFFDVEHIYIPSIRKTINAYPVTVYVSVPKAEAYGDHEIVLKAVAGQGESQSGFSLKQERLFFFDVFVTKDLYQDRPNDDAVTKSVSVDISPMISHQELGVSSTEISSTDFLYQHIKTGIILISFVLILIIAWRIYEYD
ncbi:MAG: hypothetical protein GQ477_03435 [Nanohaloarchaea archaeon]|nr:hypothetical protein [Candidatus Nanohaloarchaea archaeon]